MAVKGSKSQEELRWWEQDEKDVGRAASEVAKALEQDQRNRRERYVAAVSLYEGEGAEFPNRDPDADISELVWNVSRSAVDTVHAEIAGRQKPMAKFQTSGGDWKAKRLAKKLERYCYANLQRSFGNYLTAWELMEDCFRDASITGGGLAKVFWGEGRPVLERHFEHEIFVDPVEGRYGNPQSLFHIYLMDIDRALWMFADNPALSISDERKREIRDAIENSIVDEVSKRLTIKSHDRQTRMVEIIEAWHLQQDSERPGRHVFATKTCTLHDEQWFRSTYPFVRIQWSRDPLGWFGKGLVEEGESIARELNEFTSRIQERVRVSSSKRTYYEEGSIQVEDLQANDAEVLIPVKKGASFQPREESPKPVSDAELQYGAMQFARYFETLGVSQMRATARKEPGVTAGVALRTINDMQAVRFALKAKAYENAYVNLARQMLICAKEAAEDKEEVLDSDGIDWEAVDVGESAFTISIAPASSLPNDPGGRLQMAQELFASQVIGLETFKELLGMPDLEKEMNLQTSQRRWLERVIETFLDAEPGDNVYQSPDAYLLDKPGAVVQVAQAYFEAMYNDAPEVNLELLRRYIQELDIMVKEQQAALAMAQAPMGGAPPQEAPPPM